MIKIIAKIFFSYFLAFYPEECFSTNSFLSESTAPIITAPTLHVEPLKQLLKDCCTNKNSKMFDQKINIPHENLNYKVKIDTAGRFGNIQIRDVSGHLWELECTHSFIKSLNKIIHMDRLETDLRFFKHSKKVYLDRIKDENIKATRLRLQILNNKTLYWAIYCLSGSYKKYGFKKEYEVPFILNYIPTRNVRNVSTKLADPIVRTITVRGYVTRDSLPLNGADLIVQSIMKPAQYLTQAFLDDISPFIDEMQPFLDMQGMLDNVQLWEMLPYVGTCLLVYGKNDNLSPFSCFLAGGSLGSAIVLYSNYSLLDLEDGIFNLNDWASFLTREVRSFIFAGATISLLNTINDIYMQDRHIYIGSLFGMLIASAIANKVSLSMEIPLMPITKRVTLLAGAALGVYAQCMLTHGMHSD
ncbi:MAG: hypothetical protein Q8S21_05900 [Candidatus Paracaedibacteraceae bacterium]|nr:hypothetical protein [Candidatus Paracaedibacteraceae bacterium]